jgi:hypothetical protein
LSTPYDKSAALVVLPAVGSGQLQDASLRRWLARSNLRRCPAPEELLASVLGRLGRPYPDAGLAAMRMWGQTGDRPAVWMAAANPVYLEPRLDHLCLHALQAELPTADLRPLVDHLQATLVDSDNYGFARVGACSYLRAEQGIATAAVPAYVVDQRQPDAFMPTGDGVDGYLRLVSEVEMALHDHEVNQRRQAQGLRPVNCLWFWGGGLAPQQSTLPHPPLFANDPLLKGYWLSKTGVVFEWPDSIDACLDKSLAGFVAVIGDERVPSIEKHLRALHASLQSGRISRLTLLFRDGLEAIVQRSHRLRIWRKSSSLPG